MLVPRQCSSQERRVVVVLPSGNPTFTIMLFASSGAFPRSFAAFSAASRAKPLSVSLSLSTAVFASFIVFCRMTSNLRCIILILSPVTPSDLNSDDECSSSSSSCASCSFVFIRSSSAFTSVLPCLFQVLKAPVSFLAAHQTSGQPILSTQRSTTKTTKSFFGVLPFLDGK